MKRPDLHPALFQPLTAQDSAPMDSTWQDGRLVIPPSPAEQLQNLRVNYYGAAFDTPEASRPKLRELSPHTLYMGATGSGKTLGMKLHMLSVLPPSHSSYSMNFRSLVYDAKTDIVPFLASIGFGTDHHVILTNPFDKRSVAWDIFEDIESPADSQAFADIFVSSQATDAFWDVAAREMVSATIDGLNARTDPSGNRYPWTLRHLVLILDDSELLKQVLQRTAKGQGVARDYIGSTERLSDSLRATLRSHVSPYRLIAALWDRARYRFTMRQWLSGGGMLLVGDHYKYRGSMVRLNNLLVRYAIDTLMDRVGEEELDLTWLYLDELKTAGRFPNFGTMLTQGRSKGIRSVLAAQGLSTLKATFAEGEEQEVLNNVGNKTIMQLGSDEDAQWAERLFSTVERVKVSRTIMQDPRMDGSRTLTPQKEARVDAAAFLHLPSASDEGGAITAYYHGRGGIGGLSRLSSEDLVRAMPRRLPEPPPALDLRPKDEYELRRLEKPDLEHLGLSSDPTSEHTPSTAPKPARRFHSPPTQ